MKTKTRKKDVKRPHSRLEQIKETSVQLSTLGLREQHPPHLFILPKTVSPDSRIVSLTSQRNPGECIDDQQRDRLLACPDTGFYELKQFTSPDVLLTSWLLSPEENNVADEYPSQNNDVAGAENEGYVLSIPRLFVATPIDPLFILLSQPDVLWASNRTTRETFLPLWDRINTLCEAEPHLRSFIDRPDGKLRTMLESRIEAVCDEIDLETGEDKQYRLQPNLLLELLLEKAKRMVEIGLPASLERRFVQSALDVPEIILQRAKSQLVTAQRMRKLSQEDSSSTIQRNDTTPSAESFDSSVSTSWQSSASEANSQSTTASSLSLAAERDFMSTPEHVIHLLRLRTAYNFIVSSYLPQSLQEHLQTLFSNSKSTSRSNFVDFTPLTSHLAHIAKFQAEAQALRTISDNISRKRATFDDEESQEKAEIKKRKKVDEEVMKRNVSHGVRNLMKADVSGMKKMSSFFTRKAANTKEAG